jgi:hypothetical protein
MALVAGGAIDNAIKDEVSGATTDAPAPPEFMDHLAVGGALAKAKKEALEGTPKPPSSNPVQRNIAQARADGMSWEDITRQMSGRVTQAMADGYTQDEIRSHMGLNDASSLMDEFRSSVRDGVKKAMEDGKVKTFEEALTHGWQAASWSGVMARKKMPDQIMPEDAPWYQRLAAGAAEFAGDTPTMATGFVAGAGAGSLAGPVGTALGGLFGAGFLPRSIKEGYAQSVAKGQITSAGDFAQRAAETLWAGTKDGLTFTAAGMVGGPAARFATGLGAGTVTKTMAMIGAEDAAMTATASALEGRLPSLQEFTDNALALLMFHSATGLTRMAADHVASVRGNLARHWAATDEAPADATARAFNDPSLRAEFIAPAPPHPVTGASDATFVDVPSSKTETPHGTFEIPRMPPPEPLRIVDSTKSAGFGDAYGHMDNVQGMVVHHTGGGKTVEDVIRTFKERGVAANFVIDREGQVHQILPDGAEGRHIMKGWGAVGEGKSNANMEGVEIIAKDDKDVLPVQRDAAMRLIQARADKWGYDPARGVFGHGEVNPGHRQETEGMTVVNAMRKNATPSTEGQSIVSQVRDGHTIFSTPEAVTPEVLGMFARLENSADSDTSKSGARGHWQIMPGTAADHGFPDADRLYERGYNEQAARAVISKLSRDFNGNMTDMMVGYNAGPAAARKWIAAGRHFADLPDETQRYITRAKNMGVPEAGAIPEPRGGQPVELAGDVLSKLHETEAKEAEEAGKPPPAKPETFASIMKRMLGDESGTFNEEDETRKAIRAHVSDGKEGPNLLESAKGEMHKLYLELFQPDHPLRQLQFAVENGRPLPEATNPNWLRRLALNADGTAKYLVERGQIDMRNNQLPNGDSLMEIINHFKKGEERSKFWDYAIGRWALEKFGQSLKEPGSASALRKLEMLADIDPNDLKEGHLKETGLEAYLPAIQRMVNAGRETYEPYFTKLMNWNTNTLDWLRQGGILSNESFQEIAQSNKARMPGYRMDDDEIMGPTRAGTNVRDPVKTFLGSEKQIANSIKAMVQDAFVRVKLARENEWRSNFMRMLEGVGLAERVGKDLFKIELTPAELRELGAADQEDGTGAIYRYMAKDLRQDEIPTFEDGQRIKWKMTGPDKVQNKDVLNYMRGYDRVSLMTWQRIVGAMTRPVRTLQTIGNPLFPLHLAGYDMWTQFITSTEWRNPIGESLRGMREIWGDHLGLGDKRGAFDEWLGSGAGARLFDGLKQDAYVQSVLRGQEETSIANVLWNAARSPYHIMRTWAQFFNEAMQVGRFARVRDEVVGTGPDEVSPFPHPGMGMTEAAQEAAQSVFHDPHFGGRAARAVNTLVPFSTAHLLSLERTARSLLFGGKDMKGNDLGGSKIAYAWMKGVATITLPMLGYWYMNKDKEWYKAEPEWAKNNALFIHIGGEEVVGHQPDGTPITNGYTIPIPLPPVLGLIFGGIPRMVAERFLNDNPEATKHLAGSIGASLLPPAGLAMASIFTPILEHMAKYSFFRQQPLVSEDVRKNMMAPEQSSPYSTGTARALSKFFNDIPLVRNFDLSAPIIDNYLRSWGGQPATLALRTADQIFGTGPRAQGFDPQTGQSNPPSFTWDMVLPPSYATRYPSASNAPMQEFSQRMENYNKVHGSLLHALKEHDMARANEIIDQNPTAAVMHHFGMAGEGRAQVGQMGPEVIDQLKTKLAEARSHADVENAKVILTAAKELQKARDYTKLIMSAPESASVPVMKNGVMTEKAYITGDEKRQLLDASWAYMQVRAEQGLKAMNAAGIH